MTTEHIQRFIEMDDDLFVKHASYYRRFRGMTKQDHEQNLEYLNYRLGSLGYVLQQGCCNNYSIIKKEIS